MRTKGTNTKANLQLIQRFPDQTYKGDIQRSVKAEGNTRWTDYEVWINLPKGQGSSDLELAVEAEAVNSGTPNIVWIKDVEFLKAPPDR